MVKNSCAELYAKHLEMGKIMDGFEGTGYQGDGGGSETELAKAQIQKVLKGKGQLTAHLNYMENYFSDLFKKVIEGYCTNEDSLKYVEDNTRTEKEGQRYQALKTHAEEKLKLLNEITQVWSKAQVEALTIHVSLRKEQMCI